MAQLKFRTSQIRELADKAEKRGDEFINLDDTLFTFGNSSETAGGGGFLVQLEALRIIKKRGEHDNKYEVHEFQTTEHKEDQSDNQ